MTDASPSALIPAGLAGAHEVRALTQPPPAPKRDGVIAALENRIATIGDELQRQRQQEAERVAVAYEDGRRDAAADVKIQQTERLERLEDALARAGERFANALDGLESLALAINGSALAQVFEPSADLQEITARSIKRQVQRLREASIVEIAVSGADFKEDAEIAALRARLALSAALRIDAQLASGEARIALQCGDIELSLKDHWRSLKILLGDLEATP